MIEIISGPRGLDRRAEAIREVRRRLADRRPSLGQAIRERGIYFRMSVFGTCDLGCAFCHNEGTTRSGRLAVSVADDAIRVASAIGFTRVQFRGGKPVLHDDLEEFIGIGRRHMTNVGVTTNGTRLSDRLPGMISAGLRRLRTSLQMEVLSNEDERDWSISVWIPSTAEQTSLRGLVCRLNLPVPADTSPEAEKLLVDLSARGGSRSAPFRCSTRRRYGRASTVSPSSRPWWPG